MKQILTVLFIGLFYTTWSQAPPTQTTEENPDLAAQVDYILENLNMSSVAAALPLS